MIITQTITQICVICVMSSLATEGLGASHDGRLDRLFAVLLGQIGISCQSTIPHIPWRFPMLKLNVGFNRKVGEANYGSRGASVNLELELDSGVVEQPSRLKDRVRQLFLLAKASVDDELNGKASALAANGANGQAGERRTSGGRRATASQVRAIHTIADRQGLVLSELLQGRFGLDQPDQLSITEASTLIDELKQAVGNGARR